MKRTIKLLTALLAIILVLQAAPLSAIGDTTVSELYEGETSETVTDTPAEDSEPETEAPETEAPETEAPETEAPETEAPETEAPTVELNVIGLEWADALNATAYEALNDGQTVYANYIIIRLQLNAAPESVTAEVDGVAVIPEVQDEYVILAIELLNGYHEFTISATGALNTATASFSLTVDGDDTDYPELNVTGATGMILGQSNEIVITGSNMDRVGEIVVDMRMSASFVVESVEIAKGYTGSYSWYRGEMKLVLNVFDTAKMNGDVIAVIRLKAPFNVKPDEDLFWDLESAVVAPAEGETVGKSENFHGTVSVPEVEVAVTEAYTVEGLNAYAVTGLAHTLVVKNSAGEAAEGVSVYAVKGRKNILLGVTDENGCVSTDYFDRNGMYIVFAEDENGGSSFAYSFTCYQAVGAEDGTPYAILSNGFSANGKTLSWMSHIFGSGENAVIRVSSTADMENAILYNGTTVNRLYETTLSVNRVHTVSVSNLTPGVYYYQVGDGNVWSEIKSFTVKAAPESVSFAVIGDLANSNAANADLIAGALLNSGIDYSFAIQTGNAISDVSSYDAWAHAAGVFGSFNGLDFIHTLGRGEQEAGSFYAAEELYRTYKIGNVFVSVINYTEDGAALEAALEDMVWDSKSSGTAWQILVINQAPVSTDPEKAESIASQLVPKMAERAGIDLVLSGDECRYARTESLHQGVVTQINGVTYMVTGSLGEKAEGAANGSFAVTKDDYNALYISVTVESDRLMVNVYDVLADGTVETVDSLVKTHHVCAEGEHLYRFAVNASYVICDYCDDHQFLGTYVGLVAYYDSFMYIKSNGFGSGWIEDNGKYYYFSPQTYQAVTGYRSINGYAYLFENYVLTEGCWIIKGNVRKLVWAGAYLTNTWHTQGGATYYFLSDGACATGEVEIPEINENGETVMIKYLFDEKGVLIGKVS